MEISLVRKKIDLIGESNPDLGLVLRLGMVASIDRILAIPGDNVKVALKIVSREICKSNGVNLNVCDVNQNNSEIVARMANTIRLKLIQIRQDKSHS